MSFGEFDIPDPPEESLTEQEIQNELAVVNALVNSLEVELEQQIRAEIEGNAEVIQTMESGVLEPIGEALSEPIELEATLRREMAEEFNRVIEAPAEAITQLILIATGKAPPESLTEEQTIAIQQIIQPIARATELPQGEIPPSSITRVITSEGQIIGLPTPPQDPGSLPGTGGTIATTGGGIEEIPEDPPGPGDPDPTDPIDPVIDPPPEIILPPIIVEDPPDPIIDPPEVINPEQPPDPVQEPEDPEVIPGPEDPGEVIEDPVIPVIPGLPTPTPEQIAAFCSQFPVDQRPSFCPPIRPGCPVPQPTCPIPQIQIVPVLCDADGTPQVVPEGEDIPQTLPVPDFEHDRFPPLTLEGIEQPQCKIDFYAPDNAGRPVEEAGLNVAGPLSSWIFDGQTADQVVAAVDIKLDELWQQFKRRSLFQPFIFKFGDMARLLVLRGTAGVIKLVDSGLLSWARQDGCTSAEYQSNRIWRGIASFFGIFLPGMVDKTLIRMGYRGDAMCPVEFPDELEALEAFRRGTISEGTLKLWVEQNNHCWEPFQLLVDAQLNRIEPLFAIQAWRRKLLTDDEFKEQVRKAGFTDEVWQRLFEGMGKFIPPISDLVRFLVRDVEDPEIVAKFQLDGVPGEPSDFNRKWRGLIKEFGEFQGIDDETAQRYWRAHWRLPSATQAFDMFHRSRAKDPGDPLFTDRETVKELLIQDDMAPFWIERLIDTTFRRLSRVDARRAFETGAINAETLANNFRKIGYEEPDIEALVRWATINRIRVLQNRPEVRLFRDGLISKAVVRSIFDDTLIDAETIDRVLNIAEIQGSRPLTRRCINAVRKRFLTGEINETESRGILADTGIPVEQINRIMSSFECEKMARGKELSTAQLCRSLELGILTPEEMLSRLERVGWTRPDALRILTDCQTRINERQARKAEKLAREQTAAAEKARREQEKLQKRIERDRKNAERLQAQNARARDRREKLLQRGAARLAKDLDIGIPFATDCITGVITSLRSGTVLTADERVQTITLAAEKLKPSSCEDFQAKANALGDALEEFTGATEEELEQLIQTLSTS